MLQLQNLNQLVRHGISARDSDAGMLSANGAKYSGDKRRVKSSALSLRRNVKLHGSWCRVASVAEVTVRNVAVRAKSRAARTHIVVIQREQVNCSGRMLLQFVTLASFAGPRTPGNSLPPEQKESQSSS